MSRATWRFNWRFVNPFTRNHCVVSAITHCTPTGDAVSALSLANVLRKRKLVTPAGVVKCIVKDIDHLVHPAGLRVVASHLTRTRREAMTLQTWVAFHRTGRFIVVVSGHAVAVIDGVVFGCYKPLSRVLWYAQVEPVVTPLN